MNKWFAETKAEYFGKLQLIILQYYKLAANKHNESWIYM